MTYGDTGTGTGISTLVGFHPNRYRYRYFQAFIQGTKSRTSTGTG